jgi:putative ABC transport system ATP-binding protein
MLPMIRASFRNILRNRLRSLLTSLGIIIGVASVIIMVAVGAGAQREIENRISAMGTNLLPRTPAAENVELPLFYSGKEPGKGPGRRRNHRERAEAVLREVGLGDRLTHLPNQLSGGQQQRVAIARAMVNDPAFILADEPTGNLDTEMTLEIMSLFQALNKQGKTIIMVTHEPDLAAYTKRIITLRDGEILRDEGVTETRSAPEDLDAWRRDHLQLAEIRSPGGL